MSLPGQKPIESGVLLEKDMGLNGSNRQNGLS